MTEVIGPGAEVFGLACCCARSGRDDRVISTQPKSINPVQPTQSDSQLLTGPLWLPYPPHRNLDPSPSAVSTGQYAPGVWPRSVLPPTTYRSPHRAPLLTLNLGSS